MNTVEKLEAQIRDGMTAANNGNAAGAYWYLAEALSLLSQVREEVEWRPIQKVLGDGPYLVTNNIEARDNSGAMSHVWLVRMVHCSDDGEFTAFTDDLKKLRHLTHFCRFPTPPKESSNV